jgi:hypothetical protein
MFRYYKSSSWEQTTALVTGHAVLDPFLGCPSVNLYYKFDLDGHMIKSSDVIPVHSRAHARYYAESFSQNLPRKIRVNPKDPTETRFFEVDQSISVTGI